MRQAGSDDKGPHWSLGNEIENAQSNHLTPLSRAVAPPVLKRRENGKMGEERGIDKWRVREDGKGRRSARSAFFFPDQSRSLVLAHCKFFSPFHACFPSFGFLTVREASAEEREYPCSC